MASRDERLEWLRERWAEGIGTPLLRRRTDSEDARRFWASADKAWAEFESWPRWKRAQIEDDADPGASPQGMVEP